MAENEIKLSKAALESAFKSMEARLDEAGKPYPFNAVIHLCTPVEYEKIKHFPKKDQLKELWRLRGFKFNEV